MNTIPSVGSRVVKPVHSGPVSFPLSSLVVASCEFIQESVGLINISNINYSLPLYSCKLIWITMFFIDSPSELLSRIDKCPGQCM